MASLISGVTVTLVEHRVVGHDPLGAPICKEVETEVPNVLIAPAGSSDVTGGTDLDGKRETYTLAIPKSDTHDWTDATVRFWGHTYKAFGYPQRGIDADIPLDWNAKVSVERIG